MFKTANVGTIDRSIRLLLGAALIASPYFFASTLWDNTLVRFIVPIVGVILILTALVRFCPIYRLIGASTSTEAGDAD